MIRVLALTVRPVEGPDTRYRVLEYIPNLLRHGIDVRHRSLLSSRFYTRQQSGRLGPADAASFALAVLARAARLVRRPDCDVVWLGRELLPYGPPLLERLLFRTGVPVVLDIDDAIFEADPAGGVLHRTLRDFGKYRYIAPRCRTIVPGNSYLADYFSRLNGDVRVIPTCVDFARYAAIRRRPSPEGRVRVGWIGTATNLIHLDMIRPAMERLARRRPVEFRAVGVNRPLGWDMDHALSIPWRLAEETDYFADFDIGVMPLPDTPFTRGKCAFKMVQYMAAGVPVVASPVGANRETMREGEEGLFAANDDEWETALEALITDARLRDAMGNAGRERARERFSLESQAPGYAAIFRDATRGARGGENSPFATHNAQ